MDSVADSSTRAIARAVEMSSFGQRMMWSSVSSCLVVQWGHRPSMELSLADRLFLVGVQLCWNFVILVCRYWGMRLMVRPIAVHEIASKVLSFQSGCFSSTRLRSEPCDAVKRINFE